MTISPDDPSVLAIAYEWAWRIIILSLEMVLPGIAGYWVDTRLGTVCLFLVVGLSVGSFVAIRQLIRIAQPGSTDDKLGK